MKNITFNEAHIRKISENTSISDIMVAISGDDLNKLNYLKGIFDSILTNNDDKDLATKKTLLDNALIHSKRTANLDD